VLLAGGRTPDGHHPPRIFSLTDDFCSPISYLTESYNTYPSESLFAILSFNYPSVSMWLHRALHIFRRESEIRTLLCSGYLSSRTDLAREIRENTGNGAKRTFVTLIHHHNWLLHSLLCFRNILFATANCLYNARLSLWSRRSTLLSRYSSRSENGNTHRITMNSYS